MLTSLNVMSVTQLAGPALRFAVLYARAYFSSMVLTRTLFVCREVEAAMILKGTILGGTAIAIAIFYSISSMRHEAKPPAVSVLGP